GPAGYIRNKMDALIRDSIDLLKDLIEIPSFSKEETGTADRIQRFFQERDIPCYRKLNNVWAYNQFYVKRKPTILLNSHHDTVKANTGSSRDPFEAAVSDGKLYGLGTTDARGPLVYLIATFLLFCPFRELHYNICLAATGE